MLSYANQYFLREDHPFFLYGAEMHYFRLDPEHWQSRLETLISAGFNTVSTYIPWIWHSPEAGVIDLTGATHPRRNLVGFLELARALGLQMIVRPGPYVMSELKNEGIPPWVLEKYADAIARTATLAPHPTRVMSYLHPQFLGAARQWYDAVLLVLSAFTTDNGGPIAMLQLDNEVGMLHWVTNQADYHPALKVEWIDWLRDRFTSIEACCDYFGCAWDRFEQVADEFSVGTDQSGVHGHWLRAEFNRHLNARYIETLKSWVIDHGLAIPLMINVHGFKDFSIYSRGVDYPIGLSQLQHAARSNDVLLAGDFYPGRIGYDNFHDVILSTLLTACVSDPEQPIFSAEFQSGRLADRPRVYGEDLDLITRLCVAHGMNALNYYMFCAGDNPEGIGLFGSVHEWQAPIAANGSLRPGFYKAKHLGALFAVAEDTLCKARKWVDTHIGFYSPYYATETVRWEDRAVAETLAGATHEREAFHFDGVWRLLITAGFSLGAIDLATAHQVDPALVPSLWVASADWMDRRVQSMLLQYVRAGGKLVLMSRVPVKDEFGQPCTVLASGLGAEQSQHEAGYLRVSFIRPDLGHDVFARQYEAFDQVAPDSSVLAVTEDRKRIVAWQVSVHAGEAIVCAVSLQDEYMYMRALLVGLADQLGIKRRLTCTNESVHLTIREGKEGSWLSLINPDDSAHRFQILEDGKALFHNREFRLAPRRGMLLPINVRLREMKILYATAELIETLDAGSGLSLLLAAQEASVQLCLEGTWSATSPATFKKVNEDGDERTLIEAHANSEQVRFVIDLGSRVVSVAD
ncbi:MAG: beta-galactosidase [Firmicutes bacterium]|nr:beta-galactosidase [Bacillota bacterium]